MSTIEPQPPSSPELTPAAPPTPKTSSKKNVRRTARMSTGGKRPTPKNLILRNSTFRERQHLLDFPTRERLAKEGSAKILHRMRLLRRPLRAYQLGTAQRYLNNGIDTAYIETSWIEHPEADFKKETVNTFLSDVDLVAHSTQFEAMGVVTGDDLLKLSLELRYPENRVKVQDALRLDGPAWQDFRVKLFAFARPVVLEIDD